MSEEKKISIEVIKPYAFAHRGCELEYFTEIGEVRDVTEQCAMQGVKDGNFKLASAGYSIPTAEKAPATTEKATSPKFNKMKKPVENK